MFSEFFWGPSWKTTGAAWVGMVVVVGYAFFLAHVKAQLNGHGTAGVGGIQNGVQKGTKRDSNGAAKAGGSGGGGLQL